MIFKFLYYSCLNCFLLIIFAVKANATPQALPGSIDAGRIITKEKIDSFPEIPVAPIIVPEVEPTINLPENINKIHFQLKEVVIDGVASLNFNQLLNAYNPYLNKEVSLSVAWTIANNVTKAYKDAGYFLSRAYVPAQTIKNGKIIIKVIEGYIGKVDIPEPLRKNYIVQSYVSQLMLDRPLSIKNLESFLLRMNDIPGYSFRSVISPILENSEQVQLSLIQLPEKSKASINIDNFSSRYMDSTEASAAYTTSFLPFHQTTLSLMSSVPLNRLSYASLKHSILVAPNTNLDFDFSTSKTAPAYNLKYLEIKSNANSSKIGINYQWVRQRLENFSTKIIFNTINVDSNVLGDPLVRDRIRVVRTGFAYDLTDKWLGYNLVDFTLSAGIKGLGSNSSNDANISRINAKPNFIKTEFSLSRLQQIKENWSLFGSSIGQLSSGTLYSTEQFGYGGSSIGRAYDYSEITGDKGIKTTLELRYDGLKEFDKFKVQLFGFYDIGAVWNFSSADQAKKVSAASAGIGANFITWLNQRGSIGLAWPLTRDIYTPIYGGNKRNPRLMLQLTQEF